MISLCKGCKFGLAMLSVVILNCLVAVSQQTVYTPPPASAPLVRGIRFEDAAPIDESYRAEFDRCDREDRFRDQAMRGFRKCSNDKNKVAALIKFPNGAVFFQSKLALDIDGSQKACNDPGAADQCPTWFKWKDQPRSEANVDSDRYPFVVIPIAGLNGKDDREFREKTGLNRGDLGVVIYKGNLVPVFVADGGPHNKLGEGSAALLKAIGMDRCRKWDHGHCRSYHDVSVPGEVLFFLFPNSAISTLNPDNALATIRTEALRRFAELKTQAPLPR
jgi:Fungal chitosanase of glycosyl hydrolase group 75